jgi:hypothetical protein
MSFFSEIFPDILPIKFISPIKNWVESHLYLSLFLFLFSIAAIEYLSNYLNKENK